MTLVYRSVFTDSDGRIQESVERVFVDWLASKGLSVPERGLADGGGPLSSDDNRVAFALRSRGRDAAGDPVDRLRLIEEDGETRWVTTIHWGTSVTDPSLSSASNVRRWVWVDLDHEAVGSGSHVRPGSPRVVRELLAAGEAYDGVLPLTDDVWVVGRQHVDELVTFVRATDRTVPVIVFAHDGKRAYDQERLAGLLSRDLAGVAAVFRLADGEATQAFARGLGPDYAVFGGAMRTFLPGSLADGDEPTRHRVLGRASLSALGPRAFPAVKDQILALTSARRSPAGASRQGIASDAPSAAPRSPSRVLTRRWISDRLRNLAAAVGYSVPKRLDRLDDRELGELFDAAVDAAVEVDHPRRSSDVGLPEVEHARLEELEGELARIRDDRDTLNDLLEQADLDAKRTEDRFAETTRQLEDAHLELTETADEADRSYRRMVWLETQVDYQHLPPADAVPAESLPAPHSVAEVVLQAREHLTHVVIGDIDQVAAELDLAAGSQLYAIKSWAALVALNAYAQARSGGTFSGGFHDWCAQPPSGASAISANALSMVEGEQVNSNPALRGPRTFSVPKSVSPTEEAYMPAHIKIVKRGSPCPRLHFLDHAGHDGRVYVGYLGQHLPTARFA